jgi:hypothetical protein
MTPEEDYEFRKKLFPENFEKIKTLKDVLEEDNAEYKMANMLKDFQRIVDKTLVTVDNKELLCDHIKDLIKGDSWNKPEDVSRRIFTVLETTEKQIEEVKRWLNLVIDNLNKPLAEVKSNFVSGEIYQVDKFLFKQKLNAFELGFFESVYEQQKKTLRDMMTVKQYNFMNKICLTKAGHRFEEIVFTKGMVEDDEDSELD